MYRHNLPTTDLYFLNSCSDLVARYPWQKKPIRRLGRNTFQCNNTFLLIRSDTEDLMRRIMARKNARIIYLVDDDIWAGAADETLPPKYRQKLGRLIAGPLKDLTAQADHIVVSCCNLQEALPCSTATTRLSPCWHRTPPDTRHFDTDRPRLVHLGTNSHTAGFQFLAPVLATVLQQHATATFSYYSNTPLLGALDRHNRVHRLPLQRWSTYRRRIGKRRFHLGLYPIPDTPLNSCRSYNKILEYSLAGCAALYSRNWEHCGLITHAKNGWLANNDPYEWQEAILSLLADTTTLKSAFQASTALFEEMNCLQTQRAFWQRILFEESR